MEKKKKKKKSSYKGRVGSGYTVDARIFKTAEQRKSVEENLETPEGCKRLIKNSNPTYWFLVMGKVRDHQRDYRWITDGLDTTVFLKTVLIL